MKYDNFLIIYSSSCPSKPVCISFLLWSMRKYLEEGSTPPSQKSLKYKSLKIQEKLNLEFHRRKCVRVSKWLLFLGELSIEHNLILFSTDLRSESQRHHLPFQRHYCQNGWWKSSRHYFYFRRNWGEGFKCPRSNINSSNYLLFLLNFFFIIFFYSRIVKAL